MYFLWWSAWSWRCSCPWVSSPTSGPSSSLIFSVRITREVGRELGYRVQQNNRVRIFRGYRVQENILSLCHFVFIKDGRGLKLGESKVNNSTILPCVKKDGKKCYYFVQPFQLEERISSSSFLSCGCLIQCRFLSFRKKKSLWKRGNNTCNDLNLKFIYVK